MKLTLVLSAGLTRFETTARVDGDVLTVAGKTFDLSAIPDGASATAGGDHPFVGPIRRVDGRIEAAIRWIYDPATAVADQPDAAPVTDIAAGDIPDPVTRKETA